MTISDEPILDLLREKGVALKPGGIEANLDIEGVSLSKRTIYRRLEVLEDAGMLEQPDGWPGYYQVTSLAVTWLDEELSAEDVEDALRES